MDQCNSNSNSNSSSNNMMNDDGNVSSNDTNELSSSNSNSNSNNSKKKNYCLHCLQEVEGCSRCSRCRTALYCSRGCQEKHWPVHKNSCRDSNDTENSNQKLQMKATNHLNQGNYMYYIPKTYHH